MLFNGYFELKNIDSHRMRRPEVWNTLKIPFKIVYFKMYSNVWFSHPIVWISWKTNWYLTFLIAICWYCFDRTIRKISNYVNAPPHTKQSITQLMSSAVEINKQCFHLCNLHSHRLMRSETTGFWANVCSWKFLRIKNDSFYILYKFHNIIEFFSNFAF